MSFPAPSYCERLSAGYFAEPVNAATNLVFALSFWLIARRPSFAQERQDSVLLLTALSILCTAVGSALWHTVRSPLTLLLDGGPLFSYFLLLLYALCRTLQPRAHALATVGLFISLEVALSLATPPDFLNGSIRHATAAIVLAVALGLIQRRQGAVPAGAWSALGLYAAAIAFRSMDKAVCATIPIGTHFLWHLVGGAGSYLGYLTAASLRPTSARSRPERGPR